MDAVEEADCHQAKAADAAGTPSEALPRHTVIITVHLEPIPVIRRCIRAIRMHEPGFPLVVISDGTHRPELADKAADDGYHFVPGQRLKTLSRMGTWWTRFFHEGLKGDTEYILKCDPDAFFWRPFRTRPPGGYFGTLQSIGGGMIGIQGGCQGFSRSVAQRFLASGLLNHPDMGDPMKWFASRPAQAQVMKQNNYLSTDWTIAYAARQLGIVPLRWREIYSRWRDRVENTDLRYAVTHPYPPADVTRRLAPTIPAVTPKTLPGQSQH